MGGNPFRSLANADPQATERASRAIERLRATARHPQRDLNTLGELWFQMASCFKPHVRWTPPTSEGLEVVASFLHHPVEEVAKAAAFALSSAIAALGHAGGSALRQPWTPRPEGPAALAALTRALTSSHALVRMAGSGVLARHPASELNDLLEVALSDTVFTVRWHAITALAQGGARAGLREALVRSLPRKAPDESMSHPFWEAAEAIGEREAMRALLREQALNE